MTELLDHPAVQAAVVPFLAALAVAAGLRKSRLLGIAIVAGFACAVWLTLGFGFESLTSLKKLVLVGIVATATVAALEMAAQRAAWPHRLFLAAFGALGAIWVLQRILQQRDAFAALLAAGAAAVYCVALMAIGEKTSSDPVRGAAAALVTGLATGGLALFGASAQLAQLGIALGAGAGAALLMQILTGARAPAGWTLAVPAQLIAALIGLLAVFTGSLPWYCLLPVPLVSAFALFASSPSRPVWRDALITVVVATVPAFFALALAWFVTHDAGASAFFPFINPKEFS